MVDLVVRTNSEFDVELERLKELAIEELPSTVTEEHEARAWVARRVVEICERERKSKQTMQALLITWMFNGEFGQIWMDHPDHPETFREFLYSIGSEEENNKLSPPTVTNMAAIAEEIVPFCNDNGIPIDGFITTQLWTKLQEAIPALRQAARDEDSEGTRNILNDVKSLPSRDAVRVKYRKSRAETYAVSDSIHGKDKTIVVTVVENDRLPELRAALSRISAWDVIADGSVNGRSASLKVIID